MIIKSKLLSLLKFNINIPDLREWRQWVIRGSTNAAAIEDIKAITDKFFYIKKKSKNPPLVARETGWSPFLAMNFLKEEGLKTSLYHPLYGDEWRASSELLKLNDSILSNDIAYYIFGHKDAVTKLKLIFDITEECCRPEAHQRFNRLMQILCEKVEPVFGINGSTSVEIPEGTKKQFELVKISLQRENIFNDDYSVCLEIIHKAHSGK